MVYGLESTYTFLKIQNFVPFYRPPCTFTVPAGNLKILVWFKDGATAEKNKTDLKDAIAFQINKSAG